MKTSTMSHATTHILIQNYQMYFSVSHMGNNVILFPSLGGNLTPTWLNIQITFTPSRGS